jgi:hypothetical protein
MSEIKKTLLTENEIKSLFDFVKSKYVSYIDLQYELVDHLASAIEDEMSCDHCLSFEKALNKVYARFPITGFTHFVNSKQIGLKSYWRSKMFSILKGYFKLPKIFITLLLTIAFFMLYLNTGNDVFQVHMVILLLCSTILLGYENYTSKQEHAQGKYLFLDTFYSTSYQFTGFVFFYFGMKLTENIDKININIYLFSALKTVFVLYLIISGHMRLRYLPAVLKEEIAKKYGHLGLVI